MCRGFGKVESSGMVYVSVCFRSLTIFLFSIYLFLLFLRCHMHVLTIHLYFFS